MSFMSFAYCFVLFVFFFFKQKTAYEMRISDWSSDVCSSDLSALLVPDAAVRTDQARKQLFVVAKDGTVAARPVETGPLVAGLRVKIGRASCRERVCQYV